jgi:hypothetical protein
VVNAFTLCCFANTAVQATERFRDRILSLMSDCASAWMVADLRPRAGGRAGTLRLNIVNRIMRERLLLQRLFEKRKKIPLKDLGLTVMEMVSDRPQTPGK